MQRGGQRKAAEENIDNRVGKAGKRGFDIHFGNADYGGEHGHHQRGNGNVYGFGKP